MEFVLLLAVRSTPEPEFGSDTDPEKEPVCWFFCVALGSVLLFVALSAKDVIDR